MFSGLTRQEQWVLMALIAVIGTGLAAQQLRQNRGQRVIVLAETNAPGAKSTATDAGASSTALENTIQRGQTSPPPESSKININTATETELQRLPGIGQKRAADILANRRLQGPFRSVDDLDRVKGIGPATLEHLRPFITIGDSGAASGATGSSAAAQATGQLLIPTVAPAPTETGLGIPQSASSPPPPVTSASGAGKININTAGAAELDKLNGVGPALAQRIIEYRTHYGPFRTVDDLLKVKGIGPTILEKNRQMLSVQ
jgi:competence protein ComEA